MQRIHLLGFHVGSALYYILCRVLVRRKYAWFFIVVLASLGFNMGLNATVHQR